MQPRRCVPLLLRYMEDVAYLRMSPALDSINQKTTELEFSMASEPLVGGLLKVLAASEPGGAFLELGTGTGVATAWLLDGMDSRSTLTSIDTDPAAQQVAHELLGHDRRLSLKLVDGVEFLRSQPAMSFDLIFADAMPGKYEALEDTLALVKVGGFYVIDDLLPQPNWPEGHAAKVPELIEELARNRSFQIMPLNWSSGVVLAVRIAIAN